MALRCGGLCQNSCKPLIHGFVLSHFKWRACLPREILPPIVFEQKTVSTTSYSPTYTYAHDKLDAVLLQTLQPAIMELRLQAALVFPEYLRRDLFIFQNSYVPSRSAIHIPMVDHIIKDAARTFCIYFPSGFSDRIFQLLADSNLDF